MRQRRPPTPRASPITTPPPPRSPLLSRRRLQNPQRPPARLAPSPRRPQQDPIRCPRDYPPRVGLPRSRSNGPLLLLARVSFWPPRGYSGRKAPPWSRSKSRRLRSQLRSPRPTSYLRRRTQHRSTPTRRCWPRPGRPATRVTSMNPKARTPSNFTSLRYAPALRQRAPNWTKSLP